MQKCSYIYRDGAAGSLSNEVEQKETAWRQKRRNSVRIMKDPNQTLKPSKIGLLVKISKNIGICCRFYTKYIHYSTYIRKSLKKLLAYLNEQKRFSLLPRINCSGFTVSKEELLIVVVNVYSIANLSQHRKSHFMEVFEMYYCHYVNNGNNCKQTQIIDHVNIYG